MDIISLLITIAGILIILALYILGRVSRSKIPHQKNAASIPNIVDENGNRFTSVLDDIPATDGFTPKPATPGTAKSRSGTKDTGSKTGIKNKTKSKAASTNNKTEATSPETKQTQNILFISAKDEKGLDGNKIERVLTECGLSLGEMDIYHHMVETKDQGKIGLFRIANGVKPWTLRPQDLNNQWIPGLSLLLVTPTRIDDRQAIETFVSTSKKIAEKLNGELKNQQQQLFTEHDKDAFLAMI